MRAGFVHAGVSSFFIDANSGKRTRIFTEDALSLLESPVFCVEKARSIDDACTLMKMSLTSSGTITIIHFILVLLGANDCATLFRKIFNIIGQPGIWLNDAIGGASLVFWIIMVLNSILWGAVLGTLFVKLGFKGK